MRACSLERPVTVAMTYPRLTSIRGVNPRAAALASARRASSLIASPLVAPGGTPQRLQASHLCGPVVLLALLACVKPRVVQRLWSGPPVRVGYVHLPSIHPEHGHHAVVPAATPPAE